MFALIMFLLMGPPPFVSAEPAERCVGLPEVEWRQCQPRSVSLGAWEVRPAPSEWERNAYQAAPPDFGTYATEKAP